MLRVFLSINLLFFSISLLGQEFSKSTQFKGFGHLEYMFDEGKSQHSYFSLGEHDFFVTSQFNKKVSFLGEYVIRFNSNSATNFLPSIERSFVKFNTKGNHYLIAGKIHTPLNYWNDVYHHGRLFFPVIDRPLSFSYFIPLHTLGLQAQGQNLGNLNFGYDLVLGNGISTTDVFSDHIEPSISASFHIKPTEGMRIGLGYYYDYLTKNVSGAHSGHSMASSHYTGPKYLGPLEFNLTTISLAYFGKKIELLNEFAYNTTKTDTLGLARNYSNFLYIGIPISEENTIYGFTDFISVDLKDLHVYHLHKQRFGIGYKKEFSYNLNLKSQLEYYFDKVGHGAIVSDKKIAIEVQLSYGF
jgi:hypothetical protein